MKIRELFTEQMVTPTTPTPPTGAPPQQATQTTPTTAKKPEQTNPNMQKLAATLKKAKVIDTDADVNDFMSAYQAQSTGNTLNPDQQEKLAALAPALLKDRTLSGKLDLQIKAMSQQKPGQTSTTL